MFPTLRSLQSRLWTVFQEAASVVGSLLLDQNIYIPRFFLEVQRL